MSGHSFTVFKGAKDGVLRKSTTKRDALTGDQVLVEITHSGLCGTDVHYKTVDMALGHEGVGIVKEIGPAVTRLKEGDRVGWGYVHDTCGHCKQCLTGRETFCPGRHMYGGAELDQGSFGTAAVWREAFLFNVPEKLSSESAAPLMCGGATVYGAMAMYGVRPGDRVGIIGVGGLGHLAIQFAAKMGCTVVVFSGTDSKREEATKLGATEFYPTKDMKELKLKGGPINHLLITSSSLPDWNLYLPVLAPEATIFPIAVSEGNLEIPYMPIVSNGTRIQGSIVAPRQVHRDMLEFAAEHDIKPIVMTWPLTDEGLKGAFEALENGKMRYRGVLVAEK